MPRIENQPCGPTHAPSPVSPPLPEPGGLKRRMQMAILALAWLASAAGWGVAEWAGRSSPALRAIFAANIVFHPVFYVVAWRRLLPARAVDMACLVFAAVICAACMALRLYWPVAGARIDLQPLYLWIPVIYVFAFTVADHRTSLRLSLALLAMFAAISAPYLVHHLDEQYGNFTLQLQFVSAALIAALYFFSGYQQRFQIAQLTAEEMARLASTDALTQLANRRRVMEVLEAELLRFARYGHPLAVLVLDADHFKAVNDEHGHVAGDRVLHALAARLQETLRDVDLAGRWGGEEFVLLLPETTAPEALRKADALCAHVAARPLAGGHAVTVSCGVAVARPGDRAMTLLQRADEALFAAKRGGRNRAVAAPDDAPCAPVPPPGALPAPAPVAGHTPA